jgi:zinc D-Ala-D-Ala carboxypeptidase
VLVTLFATTSCAPDRGTFPFNSPAATGSEAPGVTPTPTPTPTPTLTFDKTALSIDDPGSLWVVVDKLRPLNPSNYAAPDLVSVPVPYVYAPKLRKEASDAVVAMFAAFTSETGLKMQSQSAYRSYSAQVSTYNGWVAKLGKAGADLTSARPGYSEHQTGLAIDVSALPAKCSLAACFGTTPQGTWLAANAWKYGFLLRYPDGLTSVTGYEYEPWHYRYIGVALAKELHDTGVATLEQFFGLPAAPDYSG